MDLQLVNKILAQDEGTRVKFKEAENAVPKSLNETFVSFSNTDGSTSVFGLEDSGQVTGISADVVSQIKKEIISTLKSRDCIPPLYIIRQTIPDRPIDPKNANVTTELGASFLSGRE